MFVGKYNNAFPLMAHVCKCTWVMIPYNVNSSQLPKQWAFWAQGTALLRALLSRLSQPGPLKNLLQTTVLTSQVTLELAFHVDITLYFVTFVQTGIVQ